MLKRCNNMFDPAIKMLCNMPTLQDELVRMENISFFFIKKGLVFSFFLADAAGRAGADGGYMYIS